MVAQQRQAKATAAAETPTSSAMPPADIPTEEATPDGAEADRLFA